eukprot:775496-Amphidinium_carterae.1
MKRIAARGFSRYAAVPMFASAHGSLNIHLHREQLQRIMSQGQTMLDSSTSEPDEQAGAMTAFPWRINQGR